MRSEHMQTGAKHVIRLISHLIVLDTRNRSPAVRHLLCMDVCHRNSQPFTLSDRLMWMLVMLTVQAFKPSGCACCKLFPVRALVKM